MVVGIIYQELVEDESKKLENLILNYFRNREISNLVNFQQDEGKIIFNFKNELMEDQKISIFRIVQREGFEIKFVEEKELR